MSNNLRKRYLVSEGELFLLWAEIEQVRKQESREAFKQRIKVMMQEAQQVELVVKHKETPACAGDEKGGSHEQ
ncbi:MAG TPA: hypothetical protein DHV22_07950 [Xanthomarina gelatinilytica]|uniref:Uncharacterized protein n=1 Tax=Xanthomarina gelatinilytica TaxID=1137281 RepID=A0A3D6BQI6_9FLAO|nr:hypothetical protein [Xanthomarina gelatinilytica]